MTPIPERCAAHDRLHDCPAESEQLSDDRFYQGILTHLVELNRVVKLDPASFAFDHLRSIESTLSDLVDAVNEGVI